MKTQIFVLAFFVSIASQAQDVAFGLKAGLNLTNIKGDDPEATYNSRSGYHAGIFLRSKFDKVAIQPELLLYTQSNEVNYTNSSINPGTVKNSFTYLSIPVMIKFYLISGLNIQAGPQFGFLLDGEQKWNTTFVNGTNDIKDEYANSDVSVSLGAGWDFDFGLNLDARYNIGVKDVNDAASGDKAKSQVFLISLGWNFMK
jgi:hypothetical protein